MAYGDTITTHVRGFRVQTTEQHISVSTRPGTELWGVNATLYLHPTNVLPNLTIQKRRDSFKDGQPWESALINWPGNGETDVREALNFVEAISAAIEVAREFDLKYFDPKE